MSTGARQEGARPSLRRLPIVPLLLFFALSGALAMAAPDDQRRLFLDAEKALHTGDMARYHRLERRLADYPLLPYLEYQALKRHLSRATRPEVDRFLERRADTPLAGQLRRAWLRELAARRHWHDYVDYFRPTSSTRDRCDYLHALIATGHPETAFEQVPRLWLVGRSQPKACDPVFDAWRAAGRLTAELTWGRIGLAMDAGRTRLANYLKRFLEPAERRWVERWVKVRTRPGLILDRKTFATHHPQRETILLYGLKRLARKEGADRAEAAWRTLRQRYGFSAQGAWQARRSLALALLREDHPRALERLEALDPPEDDLYLQRKRILAALERGDWKRTLSWIESLPADERAERRWRYWKGRALQQLGRYGQARELLEQVADDRSYYAFLAAERIGADYYLDHRPLPLDLARQARIAALPGAQRAHELLLLGRRIDARREWRHLTREMDPANLKAAAALAKQWDWHDQAIFTLARSGFWDDLELRFPVEYLDLVERYAGKNGLGVPWVLALMRQESAFAEDARSHAGASGLMQLMPATARTVARRLGRKRPSRSALLHAENNIPLGTAYLGQVYEQLDHHPVLATAAYNAGPHRVLRWLPRHTQEADVWVENIPFEETRNYVKRVMAYAVIYEKRLGLEPGSIMARMRPVCGTLDRKTTSSEAKKRDSSS